MDRLIRIQFKICIVMWIMNTALLGSIAELMFVAWAVFTGIAYLIFTLKGHRFIGKVEPLELSTQSSS